MFFTFYLLLCLSLAVIIMVFGLSVQTLAMCVWRWPLRPGIYIPYRNHKKRKADRLLRAASSEMPDHFPQEWS